MKNKLGMGLAIATLLVAATASAAAYWTPWVSEEGGGPETGCSAYNEAANGSGCSGSYCDNVRLQCTTMPFNASIVPSSVYWSEWTSEENSGLTTYFGGGWFQYDEDDYHVCHAWNNQPGFITGMKCSGRYCDKISVECGQARASLLRGGASYPVGVTDCSWTGWYSEEQGTSINFGANRYATGVECSGSYCDQKRFFVCSMVDPRPVFTPF